jgi:hypothetical protein
MQQCPLLRYYCDITWRDWVEPRKSLYIYIYIYLPRGRVNTELSPICVRACLVVPPVYWPSLWRVSKIAYFATSPHKIQRVNVSKPASLNGDAGIICTGISMSTLLQICWGAERRTQSVASVLLLLQSAHHVCRYVPSGSGKLHDVHVANYQTVLVSCMTYMLSSVRRYW